MLSFCRMGATGRETWLTAFDCLFEKTVRKLRLECSEAERSEAKRYFADRFREALEILATEGLYRVPTAAMEQMETAIEDLRPAQVAGYLAAGPLALQLQEALRSLALQNAQQRVIEHYISQADDTYGGN